MYLLLSLSEHCGYVKPRPLLNSGNHGWGTSRKESKPQQSASAHIAKLGCCFAAQRACRRKESGQGLLAFSVLCNDIPESVSAKCSAAAAALKQEAGGVLSAAGAAAVQTTRLEPFAHPAPAETLGARDRGAVPTRHAAEARIDAALELQAHVPRLKARSDHFLCLMKRLLMGGSSVDCKNHGSGEGVVKGGSTTGTR